ncbi:MAG TPA: glycine zipper domain-containing protein [Candidatus Tectomicrobia bacterium]|nr:glycine zipper domain-containing protein [Candidatus Tectomicrobia bacterium]
MKRMVLTLTVATLAVGCSAPLTTREKGAIVGGAVGAGTGAIVGSQVGHTGAGAAIGAGVGIVSGAIIGDAIQANEQKAAQSPPPPPPVVASAPAPPPAPVVVAPPPPVTVTPRLVWVPQWGVYVMEGHDIVQYGSAYYYFHDGRWWIAQSYAGPWAIVVSPPPAIAKLPRGRLHAHMPGRGRFCPPGLAKQGRC